MSLGSGKNSSLPTAYDADSKGGDQTIDFGPGEESRLVRSWVSTIPSAALLTFRPLAAVSGSGRDPKYILFYDALVIWGEET